MSLRRVTMLLTSQSYTQSLSNAPCRASTRAFSAVLDCSSVLTSAFPPHPSTNSLACSSAGDARPSTPTYCCISYLIRWLKTLGVMDGSFQISADRTLWPIHPRHPHRSTTGSAMLEILRSDMKAVGVPDQLLRFFTNHGLRTGGAQDFFNSQADPEALLLVGRWKSLAWLSYLKISSESAPLPLIVTQLALTSEPSAFGRRLAGDNALDINRIFARRMSDGPVSVVPLPPISPLDLKLPISSTSPTSISSLASFAFKPRPQSAASSKRSRHSPPDISEISPIVIRSSPIQFATDQTDRLDRPMPPVLHSVPSTSNASLSAPSILMDTTDHFQSALDIQLDFESNKTRALFVPRSKNVPISAPPAGLFRVRKLSVKLAGSDTVLQ